MSHVFAASEHVDHRGDPICTCGSAKDASVHRLPDTRERMEEHRRRAGDVEER